MSVGVYPAAPGVTYGSVTSQTAFGGAASDGSGTAVARANHTHGTPATPVTSIVAGTGISRDTATGAVTITNTGVTSIVAGTNISVSGATGAVTVNGPSQATTVTSSTSFAQAAAAGSAATYSRGDHTHGTPATPVTTFSTTGSGLTALTNATGAVSISNTGVTSIVAGTNISISGATGAVTVNGPSQATSVTSETSFGAAASAGSAATYSRGDHTHGTPAAPTAASVGAATSAQYDELRLQRIMEPGALCPSLQRAGSLTLTTGNQAILTAAAGRKYVLKSITFSNYTATDRAIQCSLSGLIFFAYNLVIPAYSAIVLDVAAVMNAGEILNVACPTAASSVTATVSYADLASGDSPARLGSANGNLVAGTWTTLFTASVDTVLTCAIVTNTSTSAADKIALRVGSSGAAVIDSTTVAVGGVLVFDTPIRLAAGEVLQALDVSGAILAVSAHGYPAAS